jgi:hypothetical protein
MTPRAIVQQPRCDKDGHVGWKLPALAVVLWVIALTMVGIAVGHVIGGPEGALIGRFLAHWRRCSRVSCLR